MKSLHVPFHFYPDAVGGTEVYASSLARELVAAGYPAEIAAPGERKEHYCYEGLSVHRFTTGPLQDISGIYGRGDLLAASQFDEILDRTRPALVHLHGISPAISIKVVRVIRKRGIPVVLTVHIPGILCSRGTMMRYGTTVCDCIVEVRKCSGCALHSRGLPKFLAQALGIAPAFVGETLALTGLQVGWVTAFRMTELLSLRLATLRQTFNEVDQIVAVSEWMRQVLIANGVPAEKLMLSRHGITQDATIQAVKQHHNRPDADGVRNRKKLAFMGRLDEAKGAHVLVDAILSSPDLPLDLDIYGIVQGESGSQYENHLLSKSAHDSRIHLLPPVQNIAVPETLSGYDAVVIPSLGMETGPLVVYDAFAAGVPVIGSRRGGIAELVEHERNGLLVNPPEDATAWAAAFNRLCNDPGLLDRLRCGITAPRTMKAVADEMSTLYRRVLRWNLGSYTELDRVRTL